MCLAFGIPGLSEIDDLDSNLELIICNGNEIVTVVKFNRQSIKLQFHFLYNCYTNSEEDLKVMNFLVMQQSRFQIIR